MTNTLQRALTPLFIIGSFCSLCLFEYPLGRPRLYFSCLYALAIWSYLTYNIYYPYFMLEWANYSVYIINRIKDWIPIPIILISLYRFKELKMCLHELCILDDTLEVLGAPKEYQRLRNWIIQIIIGWIAYVFFDVAANAYRNLLWEPERIVVMYNVFYYYQILLFQYTRYVTILSALICGIVLGYTSSRLSQVNDRLHVLYSDLFENNVDYRRQNRSILVRQRITDAKDREQSMWIIMHIHLQLCLISRKLNNVFNKQMSLQVLWYFIETSFVYIHIYMILKYDVELWTFIWIINILLEYFNFILYSILFLTLNYINETVAILHKLANYNRDEDLRELVNNYKKFVVWTHV